MPGMNLPGNFFLVGLMGAGKTTIGRALARLTHKVFYDSDHEIESRTGVRIPFIFDVEGEAGFRLRELEIIRELTSLSDVVLATGGGAVLDPENRQYLSSNGYVIYLRASPDELYQRTRLDKNRPLLQTADPRARLHALYAERDPLYREIADLVVDTSRQSVNQLALHILNDLQSKHVHRPR
ncbi:shikimate kinase AroK [Chitinimonas sp. BJB300]|uniref:shikimate kinase AroK n=1 Tax=Chitinimonas sp. BJB300 TaxID=1559339 RepID=UPI000C1214EB|nr:shikimate kinase AroK [Chitinimonas sp. BJB300]PHV11987.1 shikimate kinase AroK [Chitinimonas sp. BJB300]TSJ91430.1 shikimate kinase AroK [Chitinimonas sp. BJB300]